VKLPDFRKNPGLNALKALMGIPPDRFARFNPGVVDLPATDEAKLRNGDGIDVDAKDIVFESDGTFSFKGVRVVIYIRDVANYGGTRADLPRYHMLQCKTIQGKKADGTFDRYVVNAEPNGCFKIKSITNNRATERFEDLRVCQNCLSEVRFWGFHHGLAEAAKEQIVSSFKPKDFFEAYPMSLFEELPVYDVESYPTNVYPPDFPQIAERLKRVRNFTCEDCGDWLKDQCLRPFLHVHHRNAQKSDNRPVNLEVVCYECHAKKPGHLHMHNARLLEYRAVRPRPERSPYLR
jgi:hypothetical protein